MFLDEASADEANAPPLQSGASSVRGSALTAAKLEDLS